MKAEYIEVGKTSESVPNLSCSVLFFVAYDSMRTDVTVHILLVRERWYEDGEGGDDLRVSAHLVSCQSRT